EEAGLTELYSRVTAVCRSCCGENYELILVNDGSKDSSWPQMEALTQADPQVTAVNLSRNYGHQLALSAGLSVSRGERGFILHPRSGQLDRLSSGAVLLRESCSFRRGDQISAHQNVALRSRRDYGLFRAAIAAGLLSGRWLRLCGSADAALRLFKLAARRYGT